MSLDSRRTDSADALAALAQGKLTPAQLEERTALGMEIPEDQADEVGGSGSEAPPTPVGLGGAAAPAESRAARAIQYEKKALKAHTHTLKQTLIPPLVVVGALLFVMGGITAFNLPDKIEQAPEAPFAFMTFIINNAVYLVLAAFLVGAVLFLSAWMFYCDVQRVNKKKAAAEQARNGGIPQSPAKRPEMPS